MCLNRVFRNNEEASVVEDAWEEMRGVGDSSGSLEGLWI
jgi:hypothetical protein